jgi:hypothetical protein
MASAVRAVLVDTCLASVVVGAAPGGPAALAQPYVTRASAVRTYAMRWPALSPDSTNDT